MVGIVRRFAVILIIVVVLLLPVVWRTLAAVLIDLRLSGAVNVVLYGQETEDFFGTDLAAGDINGDNQADLAVGAYLADGPNNSRNGAGEVYVYFGQSTEGWAADDLQPDTTIYGAAEGDLLGGDMFKEPGHIAVGDLDDDGVGDLIVSAPEHGRGNSTNMSRGRVWIIWGRESFPQEIDLASIPPELEVTTVSAVARDFLGAALATGDFDGDGIDDLAMSAPLASDVSRFHCGKVYVLFGGSHLRNRDIQLSDVPEEVTLFTAIGSDANTKLGSYLAFGRLSSDAIDDLAVGSELAGGMQMGTVHVLFGGADLRGVTWDLMSDPSDWSAIGEAELDQLGRSLATGDVNADDRVDLLMGSPTADGPAGVNAGQLIGIFGDLKQDAIRDLATTPGDLTVYGPQGGVDDQAWLGESVAVGDFNGDGVDDLLTGARQANGFDTRDRGESGIVYMFYGGEDLEGARDLRQVSADVTLVGAYARDFTGYVTAGDVTSDEIDDMITSATDRTSPTAGQLTGAVYILFGSEVPPTPMPTLTPTPTATPTPTPTPTPTATPVPPRRLYLPLILRNYIAAPG